MHHSKEIDNNSAYQDHNAEPVNRVSFRQYLIDVKTAMQRIEKWPIHTRRLAELSEVLGLPPREIRPLMSNVRLQNIIPLEERFQGHWRPSDYYIYQEGVGAFSSLCWVVKEEGWQRMAEIVPKARTMLGSDPFAQFLHNPR